MNTQKTGREFVEKGNEKPVEEKEKYGKLHSEEEGPSGQNGPEDPVTKNAAAFLII